MNIKVIKRETAPVMISDIAAKTVLVLVHSCLLPQRANSGLRLSIPTRGTLEVIFEIRLKLDRVGPIHNRPFTD